MSSGARCGAGVTGYRDLPRRSILDGIEESWNDDGQTRVTWMGFRAMIDLVVGVQDDGGGNARSSGAMGSRALAVALAVELSDCARVLVDNVGMGTLIGIAPCRAGTRSVSWADFGDEIVVQIGSFGGRWELGGGEEDLAFLEDLVRSVVAGRVVEVFGVSRSRVVVVLADGTEETETGYEGPVGCLPMPLWPRWSRRVHYLPYKP